jgi:hypothetical protein
MTGYGMSMSASRRRTPLDLNDGLQRQQIQPDIEIENPPKPTGFAKLRRALQIRQVWGPRGECRAKINVRQILADASCEETVISHIKFYIPPQFFLPTSRVNSEMQNKELDIHCL